MTKKILDEDGLLDLKKKIEDAKSTVAEYKGQLKSLMEQLKSDYGCSTLEQAEKKLKSLKGQIEDLNAEIEEGIEKLQEKYNLEE